MAEPITTIPTPRKPILVSAFSSIAAIVREHGMAIMLILAALALILVCTSMQGCDPGDHVKVPVSPAIQQTIPGTPNLVTLNQSRALREQFEWVQGETARAEAARAAKAAAAIEESKRKINNDLLTFVASMHGQIEAKQREAALAVDGLTDAATSVSDELTARLKSLQESTNRELARFDSAIASGQQKANVFASLMSLGIDTVAGALQASAPATGPFAPLAAAGVMGLGMLGTLLIPKPGTQRRLDETWDEAQAATLAAVSATASRSAADLGISPQALTALLQVLKAPTSPAAAAAGAPTTAAGAGSNSPSS